MHFREETGVRVLVPHWFDDTVRLGVKVRTEGYEWPRPRVLGFDGSDDEDDERDKGTVTDGPVHGTTPAPEGGKGREVDPMKALLFKSALLSPSALPLSQESPTTDAWGGRRILLSSTLGLRGARRAAVEASIVRAGGEVVDLDYVVDGVDYDGDWVRDDDNGNNAAAGTDEEEPASVKKELERREKEAVGEADAFVTRWREGAAWKKVCSAHSLYSFSILPEVPFVLLLRRTYSPTPLFLLRSIPPH